MQKYATPPSKSPPSKCSNPQHNHHRSLSLGNYDDELCRTRKRSEINSDLIQRKTMIQSTNDCMELDEEHICEQCPLNNNNNGIPCDKQQQQDAKQNPNEVFTNKTNQIDDDDDDCRCRQQSKNNTNNKFDESILIDMLQNDPSLRSLLNQLKFSCSSSSVFLTSSSSPTTTPFNNNRRLPSSSSSTTTNAQAKGHRRSLSLRQQFENGYDYLCSEWIQARELAGKTVGHATKTVSQATGAVWKVCNFNMLPNWMQDNEYLHTGHRPPLPTFWECIKSIFRLHTETGNIWTHGIGALLFVGLFIYEFVTISAHKTAVDRLMLTIYFSGIITCLIFSCMFHTFSCYASPKVIKIFSKLDYCGISIQIIGSMTPALYYGFYEDLNMFKLYISFGVVLCILSIAVSLWDKFGEPRYRGFRAMVFLCFGLSNVIPGIHWYIILDSHLLTAYYLFILQGALYVIGSLLYANRIPERLFPGRCDYMFQSHQIFHILVVLAAFVHLNGINLMAETRLHDKQQQQQLNNNHTEINL
ncbi:Adiponectin receptor protein 2 [Dermatophagoides pteronyssinus]|uniref:Adiponectin receptor protein 2 n=1 Tax=Dermatophagoides pteronyssinus TaxID=6956 RepID=A0ABQ8IV81_DERPT|nr:Adiponectin receptor protein 2 [Dermatophagoides pteronyssinus]